MRGAELVLLVANVVYGTSYVVTRLAVFEVGPATLALARLAIGSLILLPWAARRHRPGAPWPRGDQWRIFWMGVVGFGMAIALGNWGIAWSTASNAALLITVEPIALMLLSPLFLGERLSRPEAVGAALAVLGAAIVVVNGIPGVTTGLVPHWRGDLLLMLSGLAYASYSLIGRDVLRRHPALPVTALSILWGTLFLLPLAAAEWIAGPRPVWSAAAVAGTLYLGVAVTALAYAAWNYGLERVPAPRVAVFLNIQPLVGATLGFSLLGEPVTSFTVVGGLLILTGLHLTVKAGRSG